jgi:hypothetical protein
MPLTAPTSDELGKSQRYVQASHERYSFYVSRMIDTSVLAPMKEEWINTVLSLVPEELPSVSRNVIASMCVPYCTGAHRVSGVPLEY